jgi:hypothetical protein
LKVDVSKLSCPIALLAAVNVGKYNQRAVGIRICENAFHLASTILGGRDIIEEFVAARVWPISNGWSLSGTALGVPLNNGENLT